MAAILPAIAWFPRAPVSAVRNWRADGDAHAGFIGPDSQRRFSLCACSTSCPALPDDPAMLQQSLREAQAEIKRLQMLIAVLLRNRFGRRSERLGEEALQQGIEDIEQSLAEQMAKLEAAQPAAARPAKPPKRNRGSLPAHLPRVEVVVDIARQDLRLLWRAAASDRRRPLRDAGLRPRSVPGSGDPPAALWLPGLRRRCRAGPAPERPIDGGMATEALLAHVLVNKYC